MNCGEGTCNVFHSVSRTVTHQLSINVGNNYFTAGYSVTKSKTITAQYGCDAKRGERVCIRHMRPYQRYVISERRSVCSGPWTSPREYAIRAPMKSTSIGGWYCSRGTSDCKTEAGYKGYGDAGAGRW